MRNAPARVRVLLACALAGVFVLVAQVAGWATSACQVPNTNTVLCRQIQALADCSAFDNNQPSCLKSWVLDIKQFPQGFMTAKKGTTTEESSICWRIAYCAYCRACGSCYSSQNWGEWNNADKTVVGPAVCPTSE